MILRNLYLPQPIDQFDPRNQIWQLVTAISQMLRNPLQIDHQFGRIMDHLKRRGLADNTVVIFTSDHGQTLGSHGGLTDKGWHHFEETHRVGMVIRDGRGRGPNAPPPGHVERRWASLLDIYPTICDLAGADYDAETIHGRSLVPILRGEEVEWRDTAFVEFCGVNNLATTMITCRHGDIKYGWNAGALDEMYDLASDPYEMKNVVDDPAYAGAAEDMRRRIYTFLRKTKHGALSMYNQSRMGYLGYRKFPPGKDPIDLEKLIVPMRM